MERSGVLALAVVAVFAFGAFSARAEGMTVSVLYFGNTAGSPELDWLRKGLADMTATDLASSKDGTVVEREELEKVLKELELGMSGLTDPGKAPKLGEILNAEVLVYGSFAVAGSTLRLDAKAVKAATGAVVGAAQATGEASDPLRVQRALSSRLASALGIELKPVPEVRSDAAKSYYEGLALYDEGKYAEALGLFTKAQEQDPGFAKPGKSIEDAYKYLKDFKRQRYRREMNALAEDIRALTERVTAKKFYSFADMAANPRNYGFKDAAEASAAYQARPRAYAGDTPVQAIWELQNLYSNLADAAMEYFEDRTTQRYCQDRMLSWADAAERAYPKDPFLPETIYQRLFVYREREQWDEMRATCERLMGDYPDYRMMWAVEDFYEEALKGLGLKSDEDEED